MLRDLYGGNANTSAMVIQDIQQDPQRKIFEEEEWNKKKKMPERITISNTKQQQHEKGTHQRGGRSFKLIH